MSPLVYACISRWSGVCITTGSREHASTGQHIGVGSNSIWGGQRNIHVHCDRGDLRCMYEVVRVKLGIGMRIRCLTRSTWKSKWRSSKRWRDGLECWFIHLSLLLLFALYIYRCRTPWQISPGLKGLPAKN